jgi:hypothetical protein
MERKRCKLTIITPRSCEQLLDVGMIALLLADHIGDLQRLVDWRRGDGIDARIKVDGEGVVLKKLRKRLIRWVICACLNRS